jgi:hypothetical protein
MRKNKIVLIALLVLVMFPGILTTVSLRAGEEEGDDGFSGSFMLGYRTVDVDGVETKYMEDINLEKGPRLFHLKLFYTPEGKLKKLFDRFDLRVTHFGGDPFESFSVDVVKYGKYKFKYQRRKSTYFYSDILEGHDFHRFDFDRVNDSGLLKVWLGKNAHAYVNVNRWTKKGNSTTSLDINRVEFEYDKAIDEDSTEITLGVDYTGKGFSIVLQETIQDFENANSFFLPGYADGGAGASYPSALLYFILNMPYDMEGNSHTAKFSANPFKNFLVRGSAQITRQDTKMSYYEDAAGIDYLGGTFMYSNGGSGDFTRKINTYDVDFSYILSRKLALVGALHYDTFEQTGSFTVNAETTPMELKYEAGGGEGGIRFQPSAKLGITVGCRFERRDVEDAVEIEEENAPTDRSGFFANIKLKLSSAFRLTADYQNGTYKNPFTLVSPTDYNRFRLTARFKAKQFYINASYLLNKSKNDDDNTNWESTRNRLNLRFGYHGKTVTFFAGYALIDVTREGDRAIYYPPAWSGGEGTFLWDIMFEGKSNLFDAYISFSLGKAWGLGGYFNSYKNTGSWELSRTTLKLFLEYASPGGLIGQLGYRLVDFKEEDPGLNDYKANIFEISFGYKW